MRDGKAGLAVAVLCRRGDQGDGAIGIAGMEQAFCVFELRHGVRASFRTPA